MTSDTTTDSIQPLLTAIDNASSADALVGAVRALGASHDPAVIPKLIEVLGFNNPGAAVAAVDGLVRFGTIAVPTLLDNLDGYDYGARAWANRALSQIGDPRALDTLLDAAQADFALSVRRAAAKGLGFLNWSALPVEAQHPAQQKVFTALTTVLTDEEWVVRYGAIAGLQELAQRQPHWRDPVLAVLGDRLPQEPEIGVQARLSWAIQAIA
ncbi:HEAT repeat domain-containing protein [Spirulina major CS-329]|uniref:HEAT repeat domain-containing protein n=1 Tax=Spirulina TaxID=1154 RepID=UPI00232D5A7C|nr:MULTISPECIES: HEAT repeat domain-containing protein [Spirulina]MDB9495469.1 HEAT repeat domain-containing protein [Spirulina subsalsa CS-330]MDB9505114.1 HEAT repeat domain-containing protein [Spirulina major CS-329]